MSLQVEAAPPPLVRSRRPRGPRPPAHRRKRATPPASQKTASGLYVYSNPPRVLNMNPSVIRQWLRGGELDRLQQVVLEGQGHKLVGEYSPDPKVRAYLKTVPSVMASMETLHDLVSKDELEGVRRVLERDLQVSKGRALALCKDQSGAGLLHKAVCRDNLAAARLLLEFNPAAANLKDKEGRTALHYCCRTSAPEDCWALLTGAGADQGLVDSKGRTAAYYLDHPEEASLSEARHVSAAMKRFTSGKGGFVVTKANIRIWIHDRDLGRLQQMLWEGHGNKLRVETSNNPRVKRFLDAVPYIMGIIRDVHAAAVSNDVATFKKKTADPVPGAMLCSKDQNGLNPLHKAAGLGHTELVEYILERNPKAANMTDNDGKLPLHYAAAVKDDGSTYNLLAGATADERALDNRGKFPGYYRLKPGEADPGARLRAVPDAPRTASTFPPAWDWRLLNNMTYDFGPISAARGDDSGHEAGRSASEDTLPGSDRSKTLGDDSNFGTQSSISEMQEESSHIEAGETKLGPGNEGGNPPIEEDEGMGGDVEENEQQEAEDQELAVEESGGQGRGDEETAGSDIENGEEAAAEEAEGRAVDEEDADQEPASLRPEQDEEEAAGRVDEAVRDAETGECEVKDSTEATGEEGPGAAQVDRWARDEDGGGGDAWQTPASDAAADPDQARLEAGGEAEPAGRGEGPVETDAPEEQIDESATEERSNEEDAGGEVKTETKEEEVRRLIDGGDMGELAAMILHGEGYRLVGRASSDPELQGFLNNVPVYMRKISAVHAAAREGRLRDLQAALDRRKFAVARDGASRPGATPLHVATLFGHTSVVRYLAGRFPETLAARDLLGRAPLHYAAAARDNGHFFNLLLGLGADPGLADHLGNTPAYYQQNPDALSHQQLLKEYGASETTADILADKIPNDEVSARRDVDDPDLLETLEQCYALVRDGSRPSADTLLSRHLKRPVFDRLKLRITRMDHNLLDLIWPATGSPPGDAADPDLEEIAEDNGWVVAPDHESYFVFADLLQPIAKDLHGLVAAYELSTQPGTMFLDPDGDAREVAQAKVDPAGRWVVSGHVECSRNVERFPLPACMSLSQLESLERSVLHLLDPEVDVADAISSNGKGAYYRLDEVVAAGSGLRARLEAEDLAVPLSDANYEGLLHGAHWPHGRGVYVRADSSAAVWVNVLDHVRVLARVDATGNVGQAYETISSFASLLDEKFKFKRDPYLGYLVSRPSALGNTLRFHLTIYLPKLGRDEDKLKQLCSVRRLNVRRARGRENAFRVSNKQSLGISELQTFREFTAAASNIIQMEKNLNTNSNQPQNKGGGFLNIFKNR